MNLNLSAKGKIILSLILIVVICLAGYFAYQYLHPAQVVTAESQAQSETPQGISLAAHNAQVVMMQDQLEQAAKQIAALKNLPPKEIIKTVPYEVEKVVTQYVQNVGADFGIVTDPKNPSVPVDLKEIVKLPENTPVTLNQYNVFAYKQVLKGVNIYPKFSGITPVGVSEITGDISRKISNDGKYIGVTAGYNFDDKKAKVGFRLMF